MIDDRLEIVGGVEVAEDVKKRVMTTGVKGLDYDKAVELGLFQRIANLLCVTHAMILASHRVYDGVAYLIQEINARKNEIAYEMNLFDKAFDRFVKFWTSYYAHDVSGREVNEEMESLYHKAMYWAQIPETWQLGDKQRLDDPTDIAIRADINGKVLTFRKTKINEEETSDGKEQWAVTKFDIESGKQVCVEENMDKASALMVAKRLSSDDSGSIYTAVIARKVVTEYTEVTPYKAFMNNATIGSVKNVLRKD